MKKQEKLRKLNYFWETWKCSGEVTGICLNLASYISHLLSFYLQQAEGLQDNSILSQGILFISLYLDRTKKKKKRNQTNKLLELISPGL